MFIFSPLDICNVIVKILISDNKIYFHCKIIILSLLSDEMLVWALEEAGSQGSFEVGTEDHRG